MSDIHTLSQTGILSTGPLPAFVGQLQHVRKRHVGQGVGTRSSHGPRHVGDTVMHHVIDNVSRVGVRGRTRRFDAASLIEATSMMTARGSIPDRSDRVMSIGSPRRGSGRPRSPDRRAERHSKMLCRSLNSVVNIARHDIVEITHRVEIDVENGNVGTQTRGDFGRVCADNAAAQHHHRCRRNTGHATQQNASPLERALQIFRPS